jgi:Xaa-Pro dipeptidase
MVGTRAERLMSNAEGLDAIVIANGVDPFLDSTFWYLTEQDSGSFEDAIAIVRKDGSLDVIVSILEEESARAAKGDVRVYHNRAEREGYIKDALKGATNVGFNVHGAVYSAVEYIKKTAGEIVVNDASKAILNTLTVKDAKEIAATKKACKISSQVAKEIPGLLNEGATEKHVGSLMDNRMRELGGTGNAFDTIAAFGSNSSMPHHMPSDYALKKGDTALFDFGTKYDRYCSDMTRTVFLGRPPEILERAYAVVLEAQEAGLNEYRDGAEAKAADLAARAVIDASEFKGLFIHSFGHGIGMDVHQGISVSPRSDVILKEGNILSAEPGVYIPGVGGIRIEDTCIITKNGYERLTDFDHRFTVV